MVGQTAFDPNTFFQAACFISKMNFLRLRLRELGLCLRKSKPHPSVDLLLGLRSHNWASSYRIMQISRKEISQELQLMSRILPGHMTALFGP